MIINTRWNVVAKGGLVLAILAVYIFFNFAKADSTSK
jgi:hypothetical protein